MKKTILFILLMAMSTTSFAQGKLRVRMNCKSVGDSIVVVDLYDGMPSQPFAGKQGVFDFEIELQNVRQIYLVEPSALRNKPGAVYQILAVPGEEVVITAADRSRYDINGSKFYAQFHEADVAIENAQKEDKDVNATIADFIKAHPDYEASAYIITMMRDLGLMKEAVKLLSPEVREGRMKPYYQSWLDRIEKKMEEEAKAAQKQASGTEAPDFTLNNLEGKPFSLKSLRGKYVVLDFWGSWCGWCIKGIPQMKEYYEKYKGKFEILGIDCNDTDQKWRDAVKKYELPWLHVYNPRSSSVLADYGIQGFPTKIIIGPDGKIVKTIVGEDPAFYTLLDELFR